MGDRKKREGESATNLSGRESATSIHKTRAESAGQKKFLKRKKSVTYLSTRNTKG